MNEDDTFLTEAFARQLSGSITPEAVRAIEGGASPASLWQEIEASGFTDAMLPEAAGGAGLGLSQALPLIMAAAEHCVPVPFAETMVARALLAGCDAAIPAGAPIVIAAPSPLVPGGRLSGHALSCIDGTVTLVTSAGAGDDLFGTGGASSIDVGETLAVLPLSEDQLMLAAAAISTGLMAGAMGRVLDMTLSYASDRQQFGRSLGKFQAIQQQMAVLAEQVLSVQVAARSAFVGTSFDAARVAAAKCRANEAGTVVCNIAHAIHGAIGVTAEFDLQLYTRRIKQWQIAFGSETYWGARLGAARIASGFDNTADFLRMRLGAGVA